MRIEMKRNVMKILDHPVVQLTLIIALAVPAIPMGWQGSQEPNLSAVAEFPYDVHHEVTFEGKITKIDPAPCVALPVSSYHVHLYLGDKPVEIHLGPCWYLADQKLVLREGDFITGVGSVIGKSGDRPMIAAREIHRGKEILRMRDITGKVLWR
jgi:hypothetical protein